LYALGQLVLDQPAAHDALLPAGEHVLEPQIGDLAPLVGTVVVDADLGGLIPLDLAAEDRSSVTTASAGAVPGGLLARLGR